MFTQTTLINLGRLGAIALIAAAVGLAGCKTSDRTTGQRMSDRQIAKGVNKGLKNDVTFKYYDVKPIVYNGTVQLTGFVETEEQRLRAADIASKTRGARQVVNEIMLKPAAMGAATIRDPIGGESGHLLVDTNAPVMRLRNLPASETKPEPQK